jgi:hypothetical protein
LKGVRRFLREKKEMDKIRRENEQWSSSDSENNKIKNAYTYDIELKALIDKVFADDKSENFAL